MVNVDPLRVDFGEFPAGDEPVSRSFAIEDKGKSDLIIHRLYTTDPGVSVKLDKTKVKKGQHATATVTVTPSSLPADILNAHLQLIANDPENPITLIRAVGVAK